MAPVTVTLDDPELIAAILSDAEVVGCPWYLDDLRDFILDAERAKGQTHSYGDGCEPAHDAVEHATNVLRSASNGLTPWTDDTVDFDTWIGEVVREQLSFKPAVHEPDVVGEHERSCSCPSPETQADPYWDPECPVHLHAGAQLEGHHGRPTIPADRLDG
jgi:hypothetical protein